MGVYRWSAWCVVDVKKKIRQVVKKRRLIWGGSKTNKIRSTKNYFTHSMFMFQSVVYKWWTSKKKRYMLNKIVLKMGVFGWVIH